MTIDSPKTQLIAKTVFTSDATATAAMSNIYYQMSLGGSFSGGGQNSLTFLGATSSDELLPFGNVTDINQFFNNAIIPANSYSYRIWSDNYSFIYKANAIIEGLASAEGISETVKSSLLGEAKFIRAFCYFYLVNLFGDVPFINTTDYKINSTVSRIPSQQVYQEIIADLLEAKDALPEDYISPERVRVNKWGVTALLARVYLYNRDWVNSENQATTVIEQNSKYSLVNLDEVFLKNSDEVIWQIIPPFNSTYTNEGNIFLRTPTYSALSQKMFDAFESGDERKGKWVGSVTNTNGTFYFPTKYKEYSANGTGAEYSVVLRIAEQYLIRAEARAQQDNIVGAQADINEIRARAGLLNTTAADKASLLSAIEQERQVELFTEWGHRWLDLKRTDRSDAVLGVVKPDWSSTDALYPIPESEILLNSNLIQNFGY